MRFWSGFSKMGFVENYGLIVLLKEDSIYCPCLHTWCVGGKIWAKPLAMKWSFGIIFALTVLYGALYFSISNVTYLKYCFTKVRNEIAKLRESIIFENSREFLKFIFYKKGAKISWLHEIFRNCPSCQAGQFLQISCNHEILAPFL